MKPISLSIALATLLPSLAYAAVATPPHLPGEAVPSFVPPAAPKVASPHHPVALSVSDSVGMTPDLSYPPGPITPVGAPPYLWACDPTDTYCTHTFTGFPYTFNDEVQWCFGAPSFTGDYANSAAWEPYFAAPEKLVTLPRGGGQELLRQCDNFANTLTAGMFLSEAADLNNDGDLGVGFQVTPPSIPLRGGTGLVGVIDPDIAFQYQFELQGALDWPWHCSSMLSIYVVDQTTSSVVLRQDEYPYVASTPVGNDSLVTGDTGGVWHEMNNPMTASFTSVPGHLYTVWIWAVTENDDDQNDYISVWVKSVQVTWWN